MPTTRIKELAWQPRVRDVLAYLFYGFGTGSPSDGEGAGTANKGSLFVDYINGVVYYNSGSRTSPVWNPIGAPGTLKFADDEYLRFGSGSSEGSEAASDRALYYDATNQRLVLDIDREAAASPAYAYGLYIDGGTDGFFAHEGAYKSRAVYIGGTRSTKVAGGDSNDMLLDIGYSNYAVNTPDGHYARGISVALQNRTSGAIGQLEGAYFSVRNRSAGAIGTLEGVQIDAKVDSSYTAPTSELTGLRVEFDICANAPAASYGVVVRNRTDGVYTTPTAAFKVINDATSSCKGWDYGLDLMSAAGVKTVDKGDVRFSQQDAGNLPCVLFTGTAASDGDIVTDVGADSLWADGSLYISVVDGAGKLFQKQNDVWVDLQA